MIEPQRTVRLLVLQALEKLEFAAELLRGDDIPASPAAMHDEIAVSRAIDVLRTVAKDP